MVFVDVKHHVYLRSIIRENCISLNQRREAVKMCESLEKNKVEWLGAVEHS